jgi:hypothetical protein
MERNLRNDLSIARFSNGMIERIPNDPKRLRELPSMTTLPKPLSMVGCRRLIDSNIMDHSLQKGGRIWGFRIDTYLCMSNKMHIWM